jgi:hypothetical protein
MIVTVPAATRSVRIWVKGDCTVIEVDGLSEQDPASALFTPELWPTMQAAKPLRRLRMAPLASIGVVAAAFGVGLGIHLMTPSHLAADDGSSTVYGQAAYGQPWVGPTHQESQAMPRVNLPEPAPAHGAAPPNAAFGLN